MGKTAPLKKKAVSIHSRAAKRASSPSIDIDKSLKDVKPPVEAKTYRPSVLAVHQNAGISKKKKNGRTMSAKARRRQEKGLDRAEAIMDRTEKKIERSKGKVRTIQERAKGWEELNKKIATSKSQYAVLERESSPESANEDQRVVEDIDIIDATVNEQFQPNNSSENAEGEDEIL
ncbi:Alb1-domain-containing protein [Xylogone sp. PMI_703]|nr:Alb1-domain-containing protein [Xylogone sp. PMI_703]